MARRSKAKTGTPPTASSQALVLPAEITIYTVGELHPQWLAWLGQLSPASPPGEVAEVQAAAVDQVDAAGLQLLLSLQRALAALGRRCWLRDASAVLGAGCAALGLSDWLAQQTAAGQTA
ncbi:STAS domain-containing protein [Ideonella sp.]|uniref:STAS domain-containing protein n=1 Tax=Ideonella sp. TaxID=1929293 RepID=UPI0035B3F481